MQIFKSCCLSKNKTVESVAQKACLRSMFKLYSKENAEQVVEKNEISFEEDSNAVERIKELIGIETVSELKFYEKGIIFNKLIRLKGAKKEEDSFVKIRDDFYQVCVIFKYKGIYMVLVEKIPIGGNVTRKIRDYYFDLKQIKYIDQQRWKRKEYAVFEFKEIKCHCMFVKIEDVFENQFIVDLEL